MAWYWWILIVIGAGIIGWLKLSVFKRLAKRKKEERQAAEEE